MKAISARERLHAQRPNRKTSTLLKDGPQVRAEATLEKEVEGNEEEDKDERGGDMHVST